MPTDSKHNDSQCKPCQFQDSLGRTILNSLSAHIAILDHTGTIVETNRAWESFGKNQGFNDTSYIGVNYLSICDAATGRNAEDAHTVATGIRSVIQGHTREFLYDYPCHSPSGQHWFYMRAIPIEDDEPLKIIVSHEEITTLKRTEEALKKSKQTLEAQKRDLEETNIALRVLLKQRQNDKVELERDVLNNIKNLVFPYLERLKIAPLRPKDQTVVEILDTHLNDIISPLLHRISSADILLTPQEMQVASLVKDGKSSKEISDILNVAQTTVHFHRKNLRKKLGLKNKTTNLRTHLLRMS